MEKILSQEEIDALLKGIENGKVETTSESPGGGPDSVPYDFANQDRVIHGRMPTLEVLNDFFARSLRNPLTLILRKSLEITPHKLALMKYGEFTRTLPLPCSIHVFKMNPLRGNGLLVLDPKLVFSFVDIFLGGTGRMNFRIEGRDFTPIESKLIMKVVNIIFAELEKVWSSVHPLSFQYLRSEFNSQFATIVPPTDLVLTIPFDVEMVQVNGLITLCIPLFCPGTHQAQTLLRVPDRSPGMRSELGPEIRGPSENHRGGGGGRVGKGLGQRAKAPPVESGGYSDPGKGCFRTVNGQDSGGSQIPGQSGNVREQQGVSNRGESQPYLNLEEHAPWSRT